MQTSKYLIATERDAEWGLTISTVGREILSLIHISEPTRQYS